MSLQPSHTSVFTSGLILRLGKKCCFQGAPDLLLNSSNIFIKVKVLQKYLGNKYCYLRAQLPLFWEFFFLYNMHTHRGFIKIGLTEHQTLYLNICSYEGFVYWYDCPWICRDHRCHLKQNNCLKGATNCFDWKLPFRAFLMYWYNPFSIITFFTVLRN